MVSLELYDELSFIKVVTLINEEPLEENKTNRN